ncbi:hypothetical protein ACFVSU_02665 [Microbacterium sp. NPDC058062]|uniref:hypothetical protein n=1 Tax=Microbacterium sp. NPDC058062 TaxID=3346320 RepID=UPI0036D8392A
MIRHVEKQRHGAYVRIVIDRIDGIEATPKQLEAFEQLVNTAGGLGNGFMNSATAQVAWFPRQNLSAVLAELDRIDEEIAW